MLSTVLVCTKNVYSEYFNLHLSFIVLMVQYFLPISDPTTTQNQAKGRSPSSSRERIAILYRNEHDMTTVKEVFGDGLTGMNAVTSRDPHDFKDFLLSLDSSVRSCIIVVESNNMKEKLLTKSNSAVYQDLLKIASWKVGKNIFASFFSLCSMRLQVLSGRKKERGARGRHARRKGSWLSRARSPKYFQAPVTLANVVNLVFVFWSRVKLLGHACK